MKKLLHTSALLIGSSFFTLCIAQYNIIHTFNVTAGGHPNGTLTLSGNKFYGTTTTGGANGDGCIFSMDTTGANYKDIFDFNGANGSFPQGGALRISGNKLFGMVLGGGAKDSGCVFSIDTDGKAYKELLGFNGPNGAEPLGSLTLVGNKLFGLTYTGGVNIMGNIFTMDTTGNNYKDLFDFNGTDGANPYGDLTIIKDKLYSMSGAGGANGYGNIFSIDSTGANYTDLFDFNGTNGAYPNNLLTLSGTQFFGVTNSGGTPTFGNVFSIDTSGIDFKDLVDFAGNTNPEGQYPLGDVILSGSTLYGLSSQGGANDSGCIYSIDTTGTNYTDLYDFNGTTGSYPNSNVIISGNMLYGTVFSGGGANYAGIIFSYNLSESGVNSLNHSAAIKLYPNPNDGKFILYVTSGGGNSLIEIYNTLGENIYSSNLIQGHTDYAINISAQPSGVYLYRVVSKSGQLIGEGKVVKE